MPHPTRPVRPFTVTLPMVFAIAVPMTLAYLSTPLIGIVDIAVIGQLGVPALIGAVGLGALLFDFLGTSFNFLRSGTTGLVAQALGAEDPRAEALALVRALVVALVAGVAVILLAQPLLAVFLFAMGPSEEVAAAVREYYDVRVLATPLLFANYAILGWLIGLGRGGLGLAVQTVLGVANIALSIAFVVGFGWGVAGVAAASVAAEALALALGAVLAWRALGRQAWAARGKVWERAGFLAMMRLNGDIFVRSMVLITTFSFFAAVGARFGDLTLAANAILLNLFLLGSYLLDGLAAASEQLAGRAVGANHEPAFRRAVRLTLFASVTLAGVISGAALVLGEPFLAAMTTSQEVREAAAAFLPWAALTPLVGAAAFVFDGVYIGATWSAAMRNWMLLSAGLFLVTVAVATPLMGNHGLWFALLIFLGARGGTLWAALPYHRRATFAAPDARPIREPVGADGGGGPVGASHPQTLDVGPHDAT